MPAAVSVIPYATHGVTSDAVASPSPTDHAARNNLRRGHSDGVGNARENARNDGGMRLALANVSRPHASVFDPVPTPAIPSTHPLIVSVKMENQRFVE